MFADAPFSFDALSTALSDRYRFERELGHGGMATVYLATDLKLGRRVAIKVMRPELSSVLGSARFLREIEIASRLTHPHLMPLYEAGECLGVPYYVMPFIEGETLRARIDRKRQLPIEEAVNLACSVAEGLACAHRAGFVHRDIKPENILLENDRVVLADFGIARALTVSAVVPHTTSGIVIGTPPYMSPEQAFGEREIDARSDVYALGCVVYEMLIGEPPFTGPNAQVIAARHAGERLPSLVISRPGVSREMEHVVHRALAKTPADRFQGVEEFAAALRASASATPASGVARWVSKRRSIAVGVAVVLIAAVIGARWLTRTPLRENDWLLVADFEAPLDEQRLGPVVRDLTTQALKQSRFVQIFDRRQLNEVMRRANLSETTFVTTDKARELAQRSSIRAVMRGGLRRINPTTLEIVLNVVRAEDGSPIASVVRTANESVLADSVQSLVGQIRELLGEHPGTITRNRPLRDVTTSSFEAFRKYSAALDATSLHSDPVASNALVREAVALDTGFAAAWALLGANYLAARQLDSARSAYARALAFPNRLSPAELYRLKGDVAYSFDHDIPATVRWYDLYLAELPNSRSGRTNRGVYRSALGQWDEAIRDFKDAVPLNPFGAALIQPTLLNLAASLVVIGDRPAARQVRDSVTGAAAGYLDLMFAAAESRWSDAESVAAKIVADKNITGFYRIHAVTSLASSLAAQGALDSADAVLRIAAGSAQGSTARWYERARLLLAISAERPILVRGDIVPKDTTPAAQMLRALWSAAAGDTIAARATLQTFAHPTPANAGVFGQAPAIIDGWIAAHRGDWRHVVDRLGAAARAGEMDPTIFDRPDSYHLRALVALAYVRLGQSDSARVFYELTLSPTLLPPGHYPLRGFVHPFALRRVAEARSARGENAAALRDLEIALGEMTKPDSSAASFVDALRRLRSTLSSRSH